MLFPWGNACLTKNKRKPLSLLFNKHLFLGKKQHILTARHLVVSSYLESVKSSSYLKLKTVKKLRHSLKNLTKKRAF